MVPEAVRHDNEAAKPLGSLPVRPNNPGGDGVTDHFSDSPMLERSGMMAGGGCLGRRDSRLRSPAKGCQTNLIFPAGGGQFRKRSLRSAAKAGHPRDYCASLARAKHRGLLLVLVGRSLATKFETPGRARSARPGSVTTVRAARGAQRRVFLFFFLKFLNFLGATSFLPVSTGLGLRKEREQPAQSAELVRQRMQRAQTDESGIGCGRNRADTWCEARAQVAARCSQGVMPVPAVAKPRGLSILSPPDSAPKPGEPERLDRAETIREPKPPNACAL